MSSDDYLSELVHVCRTNAIVRDSLSHHGREIVNAYLASRGEPAMFVIQSTGTIVDQLIADVRIKWKLDEPIRKDTES